MTESNGSDLNYVKLVCERMERLLDAAKTLLIDALDRGECHNEETGEMYADWKALYDAVEEAYPDWREEV